jgi:hypothetical protein
MRFRSALTITWTVLLLWQLTRVLGDAAAWDSLAVPVLGTGASVALFARWASGTYLLWVLAMTLVFPLAVIGIFAMGAWLSGAPVPALPSLWFAQEYPLRWARGIFPALIIFVGLHGLAWNEMQSGDSDILK